MPALRFTLIDYLQIKPSSYRILWEVVPEKTDEHYSLVALAFSSAQSTSSCRCLYTWIAEETARERAFVFARSGILQ